MRHTRMIGPVLHLITMREPALSDQRFWHRRIKKILKALFHLSPEKVRLEARLTVMFGPLKGGRLITFWPVAKDQEAKKGKCSQAFRLLEMFGIDCVHWWKEDRPGAHTWGVLGRNTAPSRRGRERH